MMMKFKIFCLLFLSCFIVNNASAQEVKTLTYFQNDTIKLDLDLYLPQKNTNQKTPLVLFAFGGGFSGGDRSSGREFCKLLAQNGYAAASISYTLYMKDKNFSCEGILTEKIKAIQIGVSDMWQATSYLIKNANNYNIETSKIFISGISAGAEIGFQASYWDYKLMNLYDNNLPDNFKYAGLIGGSGAIMDLNLITEKNSIPMLLAHGSADGTVPYGTAAHHTCPTNSSGWLMLFGSYSVYNYASQFNKGIELITFCGGGHEFLSHLFEKEPHYVLEFLNGVLAGGKFQNHIIKPSSKAEISKYSFCN
jgi:poly(3-hydroxybutyrate) depolymerase